MQSSEQANLPRWNGQPGFFEIWFLVVFDPDAERAYWLRYTTFAPDEGRPDARRAILWAAAFDTGARPPVVSAKTVLPIDAYDGGERDRFHVRIGGAEIGHGLCRGKARSREHAIAWDLRYQPAERPSVRGPRLLHRLPLPTRADHANTEVSFDGWISVDGEQRPLRGAPGLQVHIHGTRRIEELFWVYGARFEGDPRAAIEIVSARVRRAIGGLRTPAVSSLWLRTSDEEIDRTDLPWALSTTIDTPREGALHARAISPRRAVIARAFGDPGAFAGYVYRDPGGSEVHVAQSDVASCVVEIFERRRPLGAWRPARRLLSRRRSALELHAPEPMIATGYIPWDEETTPRATPAASPEGPPSSGRSATGGSGPGQRVPIIEPGEIFALGLTYRAHIRETGSHTRPEQGPAVFRKAPVSWMPVGGEVRIPSSDELCDALEAVEPGLAAEIQARYGFLPAMMDYEVELGVILLEDVRRSDLDLQGFAPRLGFFIANDLTARSCQILGEGRADPMPYWSVAKSFPGFLPVSATMWAPERPDAGAFPRLRLATRVNGQLRQDGTTADLVYTPRDVLVHAARAAGRDLVRGDVVLTGTPSGVAFQVSAWKRRLADLVLDRFGKLGASFGAYVRRSHFLWPGDRVEVDGGPLGARAVMLTG